MSLPPLFRRPSEKIIGVRGSSLDVARGRLVFMGICFALAYILVAARVMDLTLIQGELPRLARSGDGTQEEPVASARKVMRADIVDRNGVLLARSLESASLTADPALIANPEDVARDIVAVLPDMKYGDVLQKLQMTGRSGRKLRSVMLRRNLTPNEQYQLLLLGHPGLVFSAESRRIYPQGALSSHIVGYTNIDGVGQAGIERSLDDTLAAGRQPVETTIDVRLQHIVRRELDRAIREFQAIGGVGTIMDVETGEILAAVSAPDFDPHVITKEDVVNQFNRLTLGVYEMGSTFKIFSTAAYLEMKNPPMSQSFDARSPIQIGRFSIRDFHPENRFLTIPEIMMHSSNIGAARMAEAIGNKALRNFYKDIGLLDMVQVEIAERSKPIVPDPWRDIHTMTASYGHGLAVTPLQTLAAVSSIVNGGYLVHPTLIRAGMVDAEKRIRREKNKAVRVVSDQTSHRMRQMMRLVVAHGTAGAADVPGFRVGGKTGTAQKTGGRGYDGSKRLSSFIGVFPMDAPRYAIMVMVDEPKGNASTHGYATGGWVAAPAVGRIVAAMAPVLGIVPEEMPEEKDIATPLLPFIQKKEGGSRFVSFSAE